MASGLARSTRRKWFERKHRSGKAAAMIQTTFFLDTTREIFESWLVMSWEPVQFPTAAGGEYSLDRARQRGGKVTIDGAFATAPNAEDVSTCYLSGWVIAFEAIPLTPGRIEVRGTCSGGDQTETAYLALLAMIGARWPESGLADLLAPAVDAAPAVIGGEEPTAGAVLAPDPLSKWDPASVATIERLSKAGKPMAEIVSAVPEGESTVKRIRAALAREGRIKIIRRRRKVT